MADSSPLQSTDEHQLLRSALENPFQPSDVPLQPTVPPAPTALSPATSTNPLPADSSSSTHSSDQPQPAETDPWKAEYEAQVEVWRAESAEARAKSERERAKWEAIRLREVEERQLLGQESETWDSLGSHITASLTAASEALSGSVASLGNARDFPEGYQGAESDAYGGSHAGKHVKTETGSPSQKWENISSSPTSSFPSMSFPEASAPQSPLPHTVSLPTAPAPIQRRQNPSAQPNPVAGVSPSTLPSIMDDRVAPRTRMSLILSSLAINLLLPFVNGVMLGFGEIFARDVLVGWIGWKRTVANVGLRR
ncbi:hypothetical protein PAXRUDRAFT_827169 [Paxillus rubicundulus Ve08.2h10]|uniref:Unplaced genomic scaffold scaffold_229, whole genome shotgun sequence n=1 Tax=Paxillus rubicundulus Ve08.2h10 TaxID=930991 RepID=A0A0D0E8W7_9AGAM|nr:hypothetical protein PAXRUDRAFT_827169 [Paxillus rubicundulus Ve08.2h10]